MTPGRPPVMEWATRPHPNDRRSRPLWEHFVEGWELVPVAVRRKLRRVSLLSPPARPFGTDAWGPHAPNVPDLRETGHPIAMPSMGTDDARRSLTSARVATLATARASGEIDLVPITFAVCGNQLVSVVDHKPKTTTHRPTAYRVCDHRRDRRMAWLERPSVRAVRLSFVGHGCATSHRPSFSLARSPDYHSTPHRIPSCGGPTDRQSRGTSRGGLS